MNGEKVIHFLSWAGIILCNAAEGYGSQKEGNVSCTACKSILARFHQRLRRNQRW